eukprot:scaffold2657_cov89-Amphora_coffeaeformis.AAC.27
MMQIVLDAVVRFPPCGCRKCHVAANQKAVRKPDVTAVDTSEMTARGVISLHTKIWLNRAPPKNEQIITYGRKRQNHMFRELSATLPTKVNRRSK